MRQVDRVGSCQDQRGVREIVEQEGLSFVLCPSVWFLSASFTQPASFSDDYLKTFQYNIFLNNNIFYFQADVDNVGSDFDLNSLIEGDVDDDEFGENFANKEDREESKTPVVSFYEPLKVSQSYD